MCKLKLRGGPQGMAHMCRGYGGMPCVRAAQGAAAALDAASPPRATAPLGAEPHGASGALDITSLPCAVEVDTGNVSGRGPHRRGTIRDYAHG